MAESSTLEWSIPVTALLTAIVSVMGTLAAIKYGAKPGAQSGPGGIVGLIKDTILYIPHVVLLFGILGDLFTLEGVYSIPTFVGVLSIFANWAFSFLWKGLAGLFADGSQVVSTAQTSASGPTTTIDLTGATPVTTVKSLTSDYDGCTIQGFKFASSPYAPQTLVVTATVFSYYIIDLIDNRGWKNAAGAIVFFLIVFGAQTSMLKDCGPTSVLQKVLASLSEGIVFGGTSYGITKASDPTRLPSSVISPFPRKSRKDLTRDANGVFKDSDGNPYVCVSDSQCMPDLSTAEARTTFAGLAAQTLGTGAPAVPSSCATDSA